MLELFKYNANLRMYANLQINTNCVERNSIISIPSYLYLFASLALLA